MIRIERNFVEELRPYTTHNFLYSGNIDESMLNQLSVGSKVYIRLEIIVNKPIPSGTIRVYDTNLNKNLSFGMYFYRHELSIGHHVLDIEATMAEGRNMNGWVFYLWDGKNANEDSYDITFINASLTLAKSDIYTPPHTALTPEQIALMKYGEFEEAKQI